MCIPNGVPTRALSFPDVFSFPRRALECSPSSLQESSLSDCLPLQALEPTHTLSLIVPTRSFYLSSLQQRSLFHCLSQTIAAAAIATSLLSASAPTGLTASLLCLNAKRLSKLVLFSYIMIFMAAILQFARNGIRLSPKDQLIVTWFAFYKSQVWICQTSILFYFIVGFF